MAIARDLEPTARHVVITTRHDEHHEHEVWCVFEVVGTGEPYLLGEYPTLEAAKASQKVAWREPRPEHADWHYIGEPEGNNEDDLYARDD